MKTFLRLFIIATSVVAVVFNSYVLITQASLPYYQTFAILVGIVACCFTFVFNLLLYLVEKK